MITRTRTRLVSTTLGLAAVVLGLVLGLGPANAVQQESSDDLYGWKAFDGFRFFCETGGGTARRIGDIFVCYYPDGSKLRCRWTDGRCDWKEPSVNPPATDDLAPGAVDDPAPADAGADPQTVTEPAGSIPNTGTLEPQRPVPPQTGDDPPMDPDPLAPMPTAGVIGTDDPAPPASTNEPVAPGNQTSEAEASVDVAVLSIDHSDDGDPT